MLEERVAAVWIHRTPLLTMKNIKPAIHPFDLESPGTDKGSVGGFPALVKKFLMGATTKSRLFGAIVS